MGQLLCSRLSDPYLKVNGLFFEVEKNVDVAGRRVMSGADTNGQGGLVVEGRRDKI